MGDLAERLHRQERERQERMTPGERVAEACALGRRAISAYAAAHGVDREEAARALERASQEGRRHSRVMLEIIG
jgi:hypothetical protein